MPIDAQFNINLPGRNIDELLLPSDAVTFLRATRAAVITGRPRRMRICVVYCGTSRSYDFWIHPMTRRHVLCIGKPIGKDRFRLLLNLND